MKDISHAVILFSLLVFHSCKCSNDNSLGNASHKKAYINGKIEGADLNEIILISNQFTDTAKLSVSNKFGFELNLTEGTYCILRYGSKSQRLYVNPGDNLNIEYNQIDPKQPATISGTGSATNQYLQEKQQRSLRQNIYFSHLYDLPVPQFKFLADSLYVTGKIILEEWVKLHPDISQTFVEQEQASLLYEWANQLMEYPRLTTQPFYNHKKSYFSFITKIDVNQPVLLKLYEYKQFLNSYIAWYTDEKRKENQLDNLEAYEVNLIRMQETNRLISNESVKNYLLASIVKEQVKYFGYKNTEMLFNVLELNCNDTNIKNELLTPYKEYKRLVVNDKAPLITFVDINGQSFSLEFFKGNYIYIDVWATWCLPCKKESPYFEELSRKYSQKNIQFVSLSVDDDVQAWKKYISTPEASLNQFLISNPEEFMKDYKIKTIPRFIIINPEGKIEDPDAFRPSEPDLKWFSGLPDKRVL